VAGNVGARHVGVVVVAAALGVLAGWGVGSVHSDCEHTCPAHGPCPTPPDCLTHHFNWTAAIVFGVVVTVALLALTLALTRRTDQA
jgi:hypothetical protein